MIRLYQAQDLPQAQLLIDLLSQNGIAAKMQNCNAAAALGDIPFTHAYPEIWLVNESDFTQSRQLIAEFEKPLSDEKWYCQNCNEASPISFETCWNCQQERVPDGQAS